jgi:hypothetical protein
MMLLSESGNLLDVLELRQPPRRMFRVANEFVSVGDVHVAMQQARRNKTPCTKFDLA